MTLSSVVVHVAINWWTVSFAVSVQRTFGLGVGKLDRCMMHSTVLSLHLVGLLGVSTMPRDSGYAAIRSLFVVEPQSSMP